MDFPKKLRRSAPEVNAGSMADIAFLLLIFFLVTTTIMSDKGLFVMLPPWEETPDEEIVDIHSRNILKVHINALGQLLFCGEPLPFEELRERTRQRIANAEQRPDWPARGNKAIVMLVNDRGTSYTHYIQVYDALKGAYHDLWEASALTYGRSYDKLDKAQQRIIRQQYPMIISEAEPTDHGSIK